MLELFITVLVAALVCAGICLLAWAVLAVVSMIPRMPPFIRQILFIVIWAIAGLACIVVLIRALNGERLMPPL